LKRPGKARNEGSTGPNTRFLEQIALDWILTLVNCLHYHHFSSHSDMKKLLKVAQRQVFPVLRPPILSETIDSS
jgi:hypothetical protein